MNALQVFNNDTFGESGEVSRTRGGVTMPKKIKPSAPIPLDEFILLHGEAIKRNRAASLLDVTVQCIDRMARDGRIRKIAGIARVEARSIHEFLWGRTTKKAARDGNLLSGKQK